MTLNRRTHRFAAWLACLAILLASLAPAVSSALSVPGKGAPLGELCSAVGTKLWMVQADKATHPSSSDQTSLPFKHCPYCSLQGAMAGLLPVEPFALFHVDRVERLAFVPQSSTLPHSVRTAAQPRGPPVFS